MSDLLQGVCSVCGMKGEYNAIRKHFMSHIDPIDEETIEHVEDTITITNAESKWTDCNIKLLLATYKEHEQLFKSSKKTNKTIWIMVSKKLNEKGHSFTGDQCDSKFRNLKKTYKRIKDNNGRTGRGAVNWPYYTQFEDFFGGDADVTAPYIASTLSIAASSLSSSELGPSTDESTSSLNSDIEENEKATSSKKTSKRSAFPEEEPAWVKRMCQEAAARHNEKMGLLKDLINVLKEK